jgi:hypothetical protein
VCAYHRIFLGLVKGGNAYATFAKPLYSTLMLRRATAPIVAGGRFVKILPAPEKLRDAISAASCAEPPVNRHDGRWINRRADGPTVCLDSPSQVVAADVVRATSVAIGSIALAVNLSAARSGAMKNRRERVECGRNQNPTPPAVRDVANPQPAAGRTKESAYARKSDGKR